MEPPVVGAPEDFSAFRQTLIESGFTGENICRRAGIPSIDDFRNSREGREQAFDQGTPLDLLLRLLMDGDAVERTEIERILPGTLDVMFRLGLAVKVPGQPDSIACSVLLYPVEGLYVASDRVVRVPGTTDPLPDDAVFAAITTNTQDFLLNLPRRRCDRFLDLCTGSGVAALMAARDFAAQAWASDIAERCVRFSEFNGNLNGLANFVPVVSDGFEAFDGQMFDVITAHPPYVPQLPEAARRIFFRDGGADGEQVVRQIIEDLPRHLATGGLFYAVCVGSDRENETFQERIRKWLGPDQDQFDLTMLFLADTIQQPGDRQHPKDLSKEMQQTTDPRGKLLKELGVISLFIGIIAIHRHGESRKGVTERLAQDRAGGFEIVEWVRRMAVLRQNPDFARQFLEMKPTLSPHLRLVTTHTVQDGELMASNFELQLDFPLPIKAQCPAYVAAVLGRSDGRTTVPEMYRDLVEQALITNEMSTGEFLTVVLDLLRLGMIQTESLQLPARP